MTWIRGWMHDNQRPVSHRPHARGWSLGALAWLLLAAPPSFAQDTTSLPTFELERLELNPGRGPLVVRSGELLPEGELHVSVVGHYQRNPLTLDAGDTHLSLIRARVTGVLAMAWGALPWLELDARLPMLAQQSGSDLEAQGITEPARSAMGAPWLGGRLGLLRREKDDPVDLALELSVGLPMGSGWALARETRTSLLGRVMLGGRLGDVLDTAFEVGVLARPTVELSTSEGATEEVGNELRLGAALTTVGSKLRGELDLNTALSWGNSSSTLEVLGGARFAPVKGVEMFALGGLGFGSEPGTPLFRVLLGVTFARLPHSEPEGSIVHESVPLGPRAPRAVPEDLDVPSVPTSPPSTVHAEASPPRATLLRERMVLDGQVFFGSDSAELPAVSHVLDEAVALLLEHSEIELVTIDGHTDAMGDTTHNRHLGEARAEAVRRYLVAHGVASYRLRVRGFGPEHPAKSNETPEGREKNRRVELLLSLPARQEAPSP